MPRECYDADGMVAEGYQPCGTDVATRHCCGVGEYCLSNGLCLSRLDLTLSEGACTDSQWRAAICLQTCNTSNDANAALVWACGNGEYACELEQCAQDDSTFMLPAANIIGTSITSASTNILSVSTSSARGSSTTSTLSTTNLSSTLNPSNSVSSTPCPPATGGTCCLTQLNLAITMGLGIGVPLLAALIIIGVLLHREVRRKSCPTPELPALSAGQRQSVLTFSVRDSAAPTAATASTTAKSSTDTFSPSSFLHDPRFSCENVPPSQPYVAGAGVNNASSPNHFGSQNKSMPDGGAQSTSAREETISELPYSSYLRELPAPLAARTFYLA